MRKILLAAIALLGLSVPAQAGVDPYIGEVDVLPYNFCPLGFLPADGRLLSIADYNVLFVLYGTTYGGDGTTTFALPNLPLKKADGKHTLMLCIAYLGVFPSKT